MGRRHSGDLREGDGRLADVLEHLDGQDEVEGSGIERKSMAVTEDPAEPAFAPFEGELSIGQIEPDDLSIGEPRRHASGDDTLAGTYLEHSSWSPDRERPVELTQKSFDEPPLDRVAHPVLVVGVTSGNLDHDLASVGLGPAPFYPRTVTHREAGSTSCSGLVWRTTRSANSPMANSWKAAKKMRSVFVARRKSRLTQS